MIQSDSEEIAVSVICLAYNHEKYIRQTLEGFVNQITSFKYEVIIHEDASTDGTRRIIEEYVEKYPDLFVPIFQEENQYAKGSAYRCKIIYGRARGRYIANCEGDDYWCDSNKLQAQYDIMEKYPECSICVHRVNCINEDGSDNIRTFPENKYGLTEGVIEKDKFWKIGSYPFHTSSYFVRKEIQDERRELYGKNEWVNYVNGDVAVLRISLYKGELYYIDKAMSKRRLTVPGSYNDTLKKLSDEEKYNIWKNSIKSLYMYDEYSHNMFHDHIQQKLVNSIIGRMLIDLDNSEDILKECKISCREIFKFAKMNNKIIFVITYCFPASVWGIRALRRKWKTLKSCFTEKR